MYSPPPVWGAMFVVCYCAGKSGIRPMPFDIIACSSRRNPGVRLEILERPLCRHARHTISQIGGSLWRCPGSTQIRGIVVFWRERGAMANDAVPGSGRDDYMGSAMSAHDAPPLVAWGAGAWRGISSGGCCQSTERAWRRRASPATNPSSSAPTRIAITRRSLRSRRAAPWEVRSSPGDCGIVSSFIVASGSGMMWGEGGADQMM